MSDKDCFHDTLARLLVEGYAPKYERLKTEATGNKSKVPHAPNV